MRASVPRLLCVGLAIVAVALYRIVMLVLAQPEGLAAGSHRWVSFAQASTAPTIESHRSLLRIVITPVLAAENSESRYVKLANYLGEALRSEPVLLKLRAYGEESRLLRDERCDLALVCSGPSVRGVADASMEAVAIPVIGGQTTYSSLIIVSRTCKAVSLADLQHARFALPDMGCTTGWIYPAVCLRRLGFDEETFFSERLITGSHSRSVRAVATGSVDAAAVNSLVYEDMTAHDPSIAASTRILDRSPPFGSPLLMTNPRFDVKLKTALKSTLLHMDEDTQGRDALAAAGIDRFLPPAVDHFATVMELIRAWQSR